MNTTQHVDQPSSKETRLPQLDHGVTLTSLILVIVSLALFIGGGLLLGLAPTTGEAGVWQHLAGLLVITAAFFTATEGASWFSND